jgi:hypothetical protein
MTTRKASTVFLILLLATPAWSRILLHWSQSTVPSAKSLAVSDLVISWKPDSVSFVETARKQGYRLYVQTTPEQVSLIDDTAKAALAAVIVEIPTSQEAQADKLFRKLQADYPKLKFFLLDPNGKQPQMKGTMVIKKDGVLEITSPTAQPWIDSNVPLVRFEQGFRPGQIPLYTFQWEMSDALQQKQGPSAADYTLAIAEAGALHADLILHIPDELQKGLIANAPTAWKLWRQIRPELEFAAETVRRTVPEANIGVVTDSYDTAYEPMNLMARHNIPFRVLPVSTLGPKSLAGLNLLLVFAAPDQQATKAIADFASAGETAVLIGLSGSYPWLGASATRLGEHSTSYAVGKGRVIELSESVADPETFAQDVRHLMKERDVLLNLWNALTTLGLPYHDPRTGETIVELVNYSGDPLRIQGKIKGLFPGVRYESPECGCCESLKPTQHDGFTEFVIPSLKIAGRVRLAKSSDRKKPFYRENK